MVTVGLSERLQRVTAWRSIPERWHPVLLALAAGIFLVGSVFAYRVLALDWQTINVSLLLVVLLVGTPATIAINAAELRVIATIGGATLSWLTALRTVVLATAANMLPVPGAAVVRTHALVGHGVALASAVRIILGAALAWVGVAAFVAGVAAVRFSPLFAVILLAGGSVGMLVSIVVLHTNIRLYAHLMVVELATTLLHAVRLWLVLLALTVTVGLREPLVLAAAAPLAATAGVFPSGLGLSEALAAGMAATIGLTAAAGFAATALMRVLGLFGTAVGAALLGSYRRDNRAAADQSDGDEQS